MRRIWIFFFVFSCSSSRDVVGVYETDHNNIVAINLTLNSDRTFFLTYKASMISDSVFGNYDIQEKKIHLYSKTKELNLETVKINKLDVKQSSKLRFNQTKMSFDPNFHNSKLILNDRDTIDIYSDFIQRPISIECSDKLTYAYDGLRLDFVIPDCNFDYDILVYKRDHRTIIPDTITLDFLNNNKFDILRNKLKKQ